MDWDAAPAMIGRVSDTERCPRCGMQMIVEVVDVITSVGLIRRILTCPGSSCTIMIAEFGCRYDRDQVPMNDEVAGEIAEVLHSQRRCARALEALRASDVPVEGVTSRGGMNDARRSKGAL